MSSYFSISDILAEEERIPCKWTVAAKGVGYLDPSTGTEVGKTKLIVWGLKLKLQLPPKR